MEREREREREREVSISNVLLMLNIMQTLVRKCRRSIVNYSANVEVLMHVQEFLSLTRLYTYWCMNMKSVVLIIFH